MPAQGERNNWQVVYADILAADFSAVEERMVKVDKWSAKHARVAVQQYKNYLFLRKKYPQQELPPSQEIDAAWHAHILHTQDYMDFCQRVFGYYLHHHPHLAAVDRSVERLQQLFTKTQNLYQQEFNSQLFSVVQPFYRRFLLWFLLRSWKSWLSEGRI